MGKTTIQWTSRTWNPIAGCRRVSPGCGKGASPAGCYAENIAVRFAQSEGKAADRWRLVVRYGDCEKCDGTGAVQGKKCPKCDGKKVVPKGWNGKFVEIPERLADPLRWREPSTVFVNSTSDLFGEGVSDEYIAAVFGVMAATKHTYQILTKRADRLAKWFEWIATRSMTPMQEIYCRAARHVERRSHEDGATFSTFSGAYMASAWPLSNVWIGVSVEDQQRADERIPHLLRVPAAVRFLSVEPMLEAIDLRAMGVPHSATLSGRAISQKLDWIIVGGESGPGARPFDLAWAASIAAQCRAAGVPYFFKQAGADPLPPGWMEDHKNRPGSVSLKDRKGGDVAELVRLFPDLAAAGVFRREWPRV